MTSPTQRTLKLYRDQGWEIGIVERWLAPARKRVDLFGFIDLIAIRKGEILAVQATSDSNIAAHLTKAKALSTLRSWFLAGGKFHVIGWGKKGPRGKRKLWVPRIVEVTLEDLS
jgi:hypothetical protein